MTVRHLHNDRVRRDAAFAETGEAMLDLAVLPEVRREIGSWPGYRPTPLHALPGLAGQLGIARLWLKDEGGRFGLGSFKALGGAYAVFRYLATEVGRRTGVRVTSA
ncbi:MAG: pyridoxal-phosphate dependent enzyme, partial [Alphaproteobacteria bacterium]|nr:pyridoxal-phosphate dependent enzyme [Alphaproteobacteria bacterium]